MAFTYFNDNVANSVAYSVPDHRTLKFDERHILVTAQPGYWAVLNPQEYDLYRWHRAHEDPDLFRTLEQKGLVLTPRNEKMVENDFKARFQPVFQGTALHIITNTLRCNHACIYCHAKAVPQDAHGYDMDEETAKATVDFVFQSPSPQISIEFQGGEPLNNFAMIEYIVELARAKAKETGKRTDFRVVSNLTLMDDDILNYFYENQVGICTSLDGPKEVHDKNRFYLDGAGAHADVTYWIQRIKEVYSRTPGGEKMISALPTVTRFSLPYWREIVDEYLRLGLSAVPFRHLNNAGFANPRWRALGYPVEDFLRARRKVFDYLLELNRRGVQVADSLAAIAAQRLLSTRHTMYTCFGSPCGAALIQSAYNQWGDVFTCDEARSFDAFKLGNVKEHTYAQVYGSKAAGDVRALTSMVGFSDAAGVWAPFAGTCGVTTYGQFGTMVAPYPLDDEFRIQCDALKMVMEKLIYSPEDRRTLFQWVAPRLR